MSPTLRAIISRHTIRETLEASYHAAQRLAFANGDELALNAASLAGWALASSESAGDALLLIVGSEWVDVQARTYVRASILEERGQSIEAPARYMAGRSDEGDGRG